MARNWEVLLRFNLHPDFFRQFECSKGKLACNINDPIIIEITKKVLYEIYFMANPRDACIEDILPSELLGGACLDLSKVQFGYIAYNLEKIALEYNRSAVIRISDCKKFNTVNDVICFVLDQSGFCPPA